MWNFGIIEALAIDDGNDRLTGEWLVSCRLNETVKAHHGVPRRGAALLTLWLDGTGNITSQLLSA